MCWEDEEDAFNVDHDTQGDETGTKFKCGIVMEGSDVFGGLRALVASGIAKAPFPIMYVTRLRQAQRLLRSQMVHLVPRIH